MLYIVATPIGNLEDITLRALRILKEVDLILCEDTRQTKKLLSRYNIKTLTSSYHQHSRLKKVHYIIEELKQGKDLALVTDAGTPGISDPGTKLVSQLVGRLGNQVKIVPIPGPSALTAGLSVSGLSADRFLFLGFLPRKKKRRQVIEKIVQAKHTVVFYESPYRILKTLKELEPLVGKRKVVVLRELTKKFETIYRRSIQEIIDELEQNQIKGEFVVVMEAKR